MTYNALYKWVKSQGLTMKNEAIESYVNDPREVDEADIDPDPVNATKWYSVK